MAGIGFSLKRLLMAERLGTNVRGLANATVIAAGPWLASCVALLVLHALAKPWLAADDLVRLSSLTLLALSVSLAVASPLALVLARELADAVYERQLGHVTPLMLRTLAWTFAVLVVVAWVVFGWSLPRLTIAQRVLGFGLTMAAGGVWVVAAVMSALRNHGAVLLAFVLGLSIACVGTAIAAPRAGLLGVLMALMVGFAGIVFTLAGRIMAEYPAAWTRRAMPSMRATLSRHAALWMSGLCYGVGLWVDKWLMWRAQGHTTSGDGLWSHPVYELAMFAAMLTMVPVMVLLLIDIETRLHGTYQRFFRDISQDATLRTIHRNHGSMVRGASDALKRLVLIQLTIAALAIVASPAIASWLGANEAVATVFRFGVIGASFHVLLLATLAALAYLDQPRWMLAASVALLLLNAVLTALTVNLGAGFFGWGYAIAALIALGVAYYGAASSLARLPYMTFIKRNEALRRLSRREALSMGSHSTPRPPTSRATSA